MKKLFLTKGVKLSSNDLNLIKGGATTPEEADCCEAPKNTCASGCGSSGAYYYSVNGVSKTICCN